MAEAAYRVVQLGRQSSFATAVAATTRFPCDPGSGEFTLNRASEIPDEDLGRAIRNAQPGRGSHGVRIATATLSAVARFEDIGHLTARRTRTRSRALCCALLIGRGPVSVDVRARCPAFQRKRK